MVAQPSFDEGWMPEIPEGDRLWMTGPIQPGYGFVAYFEDRYGVRRESVYEDEMPVILVITLPPGLVNSWASCIQYYPPNYVIANFLFRRINLGPSGTYRLGPFYQAPGEPYGKYAFRIGVLSVDSRGNGYWDQVVTFLEVKEKVITVTVTQREERTVTQVVTQVTAVMVTAERTVTQPTIITVEKPAFITVEKSITQTVTTTTQAIEAGIPLTLSIAAIVIIAVLAALFLRASRKKTS